MIVSRQSAIVLIVLTVTVSGMAVPGAGELVGTAQAQSSTGLGSVDIDASDLPGDGSESNPYEISNASELQAMEDDLDANYELVNDIDASNTAQFNSGDGFDPVGDGSGDFKGNFDGNGFRITGLTIDRGSSREEVGLFGEVDDATIESVSLDSVDITGNRSVGALAGFLEQDTTVRRVSVNGSVSGGTNTGGLIGAVEDSTVKAGSVTGTVTGNTDVGGLAGQNVGGSILQSSSEATVTATGEQQSGGFVSARAGGLVGGNFNDAVINLSYATGSVSGRKIGGITGENFNGSQVTNAYAAGSVDGETDAPVGGLIGDNFRTCPFQANSQQCQNYDAASVSDSYWDTTETGQSTSDGNAIGLTTVEMQGTAAEQNMGGFEFDENWETVSDDYPVLIAVSDTDQGTGSDSPLEGAAGEFDADGNGDIEITELGQAGQAFASGDISITQLGEVGAAFASS